MRIEDIQAVKHPPIHFPSYCAILPYALGEPPDTLVT